MSDQSQHSYSSAYPPEIPVLSGIKEFFEEFYRISDTPGEHENYADFFAEGAEVAVGRFRIGKENGRDGKLWIGFLFFRWRCESGKVIGDVIHWGWIIRTGLDNWYSSIRSPRSLLSTSSHPTLTYNSPISLLINASDSSKSYPNN